MKKVLLILADGFESYEASAFIDVIGWNLVDGDGSAKLISCGFSRVVNTSFGQKFIPDILIDEVNPGEFDALAIPGGFVEYDFYKEAYDEKFLDIIRRFDDSGKLIASICVASLAIGKSGALRGREGTTYGVKPERQEELRGYGVRVVNQPIVTDGNIITSWDPSTAIDVAFELLERLTSRENAAHIRNIMGFK
ncbi:MAG: DJ-1/PfpI family protein [Candidatus Kapaibacterium sp.]